MEEETRRRRETEETKIAVMRDSVSKLENTLNAEIKRRVEANKVRERIVYVSLLYWTSVRSTE